MQTVDWCTGDCISNVRKIRTPEWRRFGVFVDNLKHIHQINLFSLVLALQIKLPAGKNLAVKAQLFIIRQRNKLVFGPSSRKKFCDLGLVKKMGFAWWRLLFIFHIEF